MRKEKKKGEADEDAEAEKLLHPDDIWRPEGVD